MEWLGGSLNHLLSENINLEVIYEKSSSVWQTLFSFWIENDSDFGFKFLKEIEIQIVN